MNNPRAIKWRDNKSTLYDASDLPYLRKKSDNGSGRLAYFNPNSNQYEVPADIISIPQELIELRQRREEQQALRSASIQKENNKVPASLRLHQHY